ncbi:hypothetical protein RN001_000104 [Aquatica leii]|uniref:FXNA-like protease n=1 Tax=Aquatica leii TaxID=1421715 RepID=A0AAN7QLV2_9COLE|nr:hypothetical protein RN001_000104 [Aquatica leii]
MSYRPKGRSISSEKEIPFYVMDLEKEGKDSKKSIHNLSPLIGFVFIAIIFGFYGCVYLIDGILPTALKLEDERKFPNDFIGERAQMHLQSLTNIGPRIAGTPENEIQAVEFLNNAISKIQKLAHSEQKIEVDLQTVSGSFHLDYKPHGAITAYNDVQNVVVKLHSRSPSNVSVLINAHFDSVPTSPGGSDDGINCAVMLEILQKLSQTSQPLHHNVIFLFNGAEETPLQASHGFITQHKWAKEVKVVVNLEAAGVGGKEILFQSGPKSPWLLKYYKKVPRPNGQAAGEELFQSGLIPSDTDFRIFRDFGNTVGLDFAFNRNGYRYHTKYDEFDAIPSGSYQHVGDNTLALVRGLANASELTNLDEETPEPVVYFDFMTLFMISYSGSMIIVINVIVLIVSIGVAVKALYGFGNVLSYTVWCVFVMLLAVVITGLYVLLQAVVIDALNYSMSWYNNTWIILGLYVLPIVIISFAVIGFFNSTNAKNNWSVSIQAQVQLHVIRVIWSIVILIGTAFGIRAVYAIMVPVLFHTVSFLIIEIFRLQHSVKKWLIIYVTGTIIPTMFLMRAALEVISVIAPICGRISSTKNPELFIGFLTLFLTVLISSAYSPLITLVYKPQILMVALSTIYFIFLIIVFTPLGFPYSANEKFPAPQRFWIYHMTKRFHDDNHNIYKNNSGYFLLNLDRNSPDSIRKHVQELKNESVDCDGIFCGYPIASSRMVPILSASTWIPTVEPNLPNSIGLQLNSKDVVDFNKTVFNFTIFGTNYMNVYVSSKNNATVTAISLVEHLPQPIIWNNHSVYLILYLCAKEKSPLTFSIEVDKIGDEKMLDIAVVGRFMYDKENVKTPEYTRFLSQFPDWADVYSWLGVYESWVY